MPRRTLPLVLLFAAGCGGAADEEPAPDDGAVSVVVVLPPEWPNPIYPDPPEITIEHGWQRRFATTGARTEIELPEPGQYRVGAITGEGGCFDTAGVGIAGNPTIDVGDGDIVRLIDTGEICD